MIRAALLALTGSLLTFNSQAETFTVAVPDIPVIHTVNFSNGQIGGDCYDRVLPLLPEKHILRSMSWNQALQGLIDKRIDMLPCGEYSEERAAKGVRFVGPVSQYKIILVSRSQLNLTLDNLDTATGAFVLGDDEPERFNLKPEQYFWVNTPQQLIQAIIEGKADYSIAPEPVVRKVPESASKDYRLADIEVRSTYLLLRPGIEQKLDIKALQARAEKLFSNTSQ